MDGSYLIRYLFARGWAPRRQPWKSTSSGARRWATARRSATPCRIVQARRGAAPVVVVSAPAGHHRRPAGPGHARGGGRQERARRPDGRRRGAAQALPCDREGRAGQRGQRARSGKEAAAVAAEIDSSLDELASLLASLVALKELTPRTRDFVVSRGERLSAQMFAAALAAAGTPSAYVDATEIVFTDGPFGGASPNLALTDAGGAQEAAAADRRGQGAGRSRLHRQRRHRGRRGHRDRASARSRRWAAAAPT